MFDRIRHACAAVIDDIEEEWGRMVTPGTPPAADAPGTEPPIRMDPDSAVLESGRLDRSVPVVSLRGIVKQSMTKKSRMDLSTQMLGMCQLSGWQATTLNPEMGEAEKLAIVSARFGKLASEDDTAAKYTELISLAAVVMGWAQGIARREARERKRRSRERRRIRKEERQRAKRKAKGDDR